MNKHIKQKKKSYLEFKRNTCKEDLLFIKKYPLAYPVCKAVGMSRVEFDRVFKKVFKVSIRVECDRQTTEMALRGILRRRTYGKRVC